VDRSRIKDMGSRNQPAVANKGMRFWECPVSLNRVQWAPIKGRVELGYRETVVRTFGGGSDEMMRSVIATVAMGLPRTAMNMPVKK